MKLKIETLDQKNLTLACETLAEGDSDLAFIYKTFGAPPLWKREESFATLVHIILEQQVSLASALAAFNKLKEKIGDITAENVLKLSDEELRAAYLSRQKTIYVRELARAVSDGKLDLDELRRHSDQEVKNELMKIKGIGSWTADIYLLMAMSRPDIMPKGDLALHIGWQKIKSAGKRPTSEEFQSIAEKWQPLRSVAARLLWHFYLERRKPKNEFARNIQARSDS